MRRRITWLLACRMSEAVKRKGSVMVKIGLSAASLLLASLQAVQGAVTIFDFEDGKAPKIFSKTYFVGVTNRFMTGQCLLIDGGEAGNVHSMCCDGE